MYGVNIKRIRKKRKITQESLAKRIGVSRQAICMWETDKRELRGSTLKKMAQIFGVRSVEILGEDVIPEGKNAYRAMKTAKTVLKKEVGDMKNSTILLARKNGKGDVLMKKTQSKATFKVAAPAANRVAVTGSFNSWDKSGMPLKKDKSGVWTGGISLKPGRYEYKFIVDGQWWTDPANKNTAGNPFGSENSVVEIKC